MTRFIRLAVFCLCAPLLAGCAAEHWVKPGAGPQQFDADNSACFAAASAQFPPMVHPWQPDPGHTTPVTTQCTHTPGTVTCTQSGGDFVQQPSYIDVDDNQGARDAAVRSCLYKHGWAPAS